MTDIALLKQRLMDSYISKKFQQKKCKGGQEVKKEGHINEESWNSEIIIDPTNHANPNKLILQTNITL